MRSRLILLLASPLAACHPGVDDCGQPLVGCGDGYIGPIAVYHALTPWPPIEGHPFVREVLVLGPGAEQEITWESCDWDPWVNRIVPCSEPSGRRPIGAVSGGHGFVSVELPVAPPPVPEACTDPAQWQVWTNAVAPIPGPECESGVWEVVTLRPSPEAAPLEIYGTINGVRTTGFPVYPTLADEVPVLALEDTEGGGLRVRAELALPQDVLDASDGNLSMGGDGKTVFFKLDPEVGALVTPTVWQNQRPVAGVVTDAFELVDAPVDALRIRIQLSPLRAFPFEQTVAWVVEITRDAASGRWSQRTLLPSGDGP